MLASPHDSLFKALFSDPRRAADLLRERLPPSVAAAIRWSTLTRESGSFIDEGMRGCHADLLFSAEMNGQRVRLYLLFEHQSTHDRNMPRRLLRYMDRIWDSLPPTATLPIILPVVLYHGESAWPDPTDFHAMFTLPPGIAPYVPQFRFMLIDLAALDPAALHAWAVSACVRLALLVLQSSRSPTHLDEQLLRWRHLIVQVMAEPFEDGAITVIIRYILELWGAQEFHHAVQVMTDIEAKTTHPTGGTMETIAQMLRREGRAEGRAEGQRSMILDLIHLRLGDVPSSIRAQIESADEPELHLWLARAARSASLDDLLTPG